MVSYGKESTGEEVVKLRHIEKIYVRYVRV